jgi:hypothetical protein
LPPAQPRPGPAGWPAARASRHQPCCLEGGTRKRGGAESSVCGWFCGPLRGAPALSVQGRRTRG